MPNPRPKPGKLFQKGNKANPLGAGAHNKDLKAVRRLTQQEVAEVGGLILNMDVIGLKKMRHAKDTSVFKVWICSVALKAIDRGDAQALNVILDRIVGKPKQDLNVVQLTSEVPLTQEKIQDFKKRFGDEY